MFATARATAQSCCSRCSGVQPTCSARSVDDFDAVQAEQAGDVLAEHGLLANGLDESQLHGRIEDLERHSGEAGAGTDVNEAVRGIGTPGEDAGERVEEMLGADGFGVAQGGEVELPIPVEQLALIGDERHYLSAGEMNMEELLRSSGRVCPLQGIIFDNEERAGGMPV